MAARVKLRLETLNIPTTHKERKEIYRLLSKEGRLTDAGVVAFSDEDFKRMVEEVKQITKKKEKEKARTKRFSSKGVQ